MLRLHIHKTGHKPVMIKIPAYELCTKYATKHSQLSIQHMEDTYINQNLFKYHLIS